MIDLLSGQVANRTKNSVVLMVGGVGFRVNVPTSAFETITEDGQTVLLYTHLIVREDALTLFGFTNEEDKSLFETLITVSGVGPKLALAILSTLSAGQLRSAVGKDEPGVLQRVPGIGKKTAEKIVFELKNKIGGDGLSPITVISDLDRDVIAALTSLGYSLAEAQVRLAAIPRGTPEDLNTRIALALQAGG